MNPTGEIFLCADGSECSYDACPLFNKETDKCKIEKLINYMKDTTKPQNEAEMDIPEREQKAANPMYDYPPTKEDLIAVLGEVFDTDLEYLSTGTVKTRKFLSDTWQGYNDKLVELGYGWYSDKETKTYEWRFGYVRDAVSKKQPLKLVAVTSGIDVSEIEWKVKSEGNTVEARTGEKAWAPIMGWDRDLKKSNGIPKKACVTLHDYLKTHEALNNGEYVFTMNKDETFFDREPVSRT